MTSNGTIPAPIAWTPSPYWDGNDGSWNSFYVQAGTPPQEFRVLPASTGQELWLPDPLGCTTISPTDTGYCGYIRGVMPFNGANSSGFLSNESSSWDAIGVFTLTAEEYVLGYNGNGAYGLETVVWGNISTSPRLEKQVVASTADTTWWIGVVGLGPKSINFTTYNDPQDSYLSSLVNTEIIPSLSWGYTAGASYSRTPASLTLGGYDSSRFEPSSVSLRMSSDDSRSLQVGLQAIFAVNTLQSSANLLSTGVYALIDSAVAHIWVPEDSIPAWTSAFGLTYDNSTDLFLVNDTIHTQLLALNPTITFQLGQSSSPSGDAASKQNITLPYAAFDLQANYPYYRAATNYFPIRRAANASQYVIGRTFLQEAYIIADYDRQNFTVAQAVYSNTTATTNLTAIQRPSQANDTDITTSPSLSGGAIAGIVVGAVSALAILGLLAWLWRRSRRRRAGYPNTPEVFEKDADDTSSAELPTVPVAEVSAESERVEAPGSKVAAEMGERTAKWGAHGVQELYDKPVGHETGMLAELRGDEGQRVELEDKRRFSFDGGKDIVSYFATTPTATVA